MPRGEQGHAKKNKSSKVRGKTLLRVSQTRFLNNFIGIYAAPNQNPALTIPNNTFVNNTFDGQRLRARPFVGIQATLAYPSGTAPLGTNIYPLQNAMGWAGIYVFDVNILDIYSNTPSNSNAFRRLATGIAVMRGSLRVNDARFEDIQPHISYNPSIAPQGTAIHLQAMKARSIPTLEVLGMMTNARQNIGTLTYENCYRGISAEEAHTIISNCGMRRTHTGIRLLRCNYVQNNLKGCRIERAENTGIALMYCDVQSQNIVAYHFVEMRPALAGNNAVGIRIIENGTESTTLTVERNEIQSINAQAAILVDGHRALISGSNIVSNDVFMQGTASNKAGFLITNSQRLSLSCNNVAGNAQTRSRPNNYAMYGSVLKANTWACNTVDNTHTGIFFDNTNEVVLQGNRFDRHYFGLLLNGNATIGIQGDTSNGGNGNRWLGNAVFDAENFNASQIGLDASAFTINSSPNPQFKPNNFNISWFRDVALSQPNLPNFGCDTFATISCEANNFRVLDNTAARDLSIANNNFSTTEYPENATHNGKRQLYRKLKEDANLRNNTSFQQFQQQEFLSPVGLLDSISVLQMQALRIDSLTWQQMQHYQTLCSLTMDSIHILDSLLTIPSPILLAEREALHLRWWSAAAQLQTLVEAQIDAETALLQQVKNTNSNISTQALHEQIEQSVNDIFLETVALGVIEFSPSQASILQLIAQYCPQEGGIGVYRARSLLMLVSDNVDLLANNCQSSRLTNNLAEEPTNTAKNSNFLLFPNPAADYLHLAASSPLSANSSIEIIDVLGRLVHSEQITEPTQNLRISLQNIPSGWYTLRILQAQTIGSQSFIIAK